MDKELLKIENLTIGFPTKSGIHTVVDHVNLEVGKGEIVGIVGESGSGKSMTSLAVMGLLSEEAQVSEGSIQLNGQELLGMSREEQEYVDGFSGTDDISESGHEDWYSGGRKPETAYRFR